MKTQDNKPTAAEDGKETLTLMARDYGSSAQPAGQDQGRTARDPGR
jgi:hypothetical protein